MQRSNVAHSAAQEVGVKQSGNQMTIHARSEELRLSVPPPVMLDAYCKNYPDAAKLFFQWAEEEARHRRAIDAKIVDSHIRDSRLGLCLGFLIALAGLAVAAWAVACDQPWLAAVLGGGTLVSLALAFIRGSRFASSAQEKPSQN